MNDNTPIQTEGQDIVQIGTIATALAKAQAEMGVALKKADNPHFKCKYADLSSVVSACMPALNSNGIAVVQPTGEDEHGRYVETILIHGASGQTLSCRVPLIVQKNDMQGYGSAVTYARRYGLMGMAGIAPEDDDGNGAVKDNGKWLDKAIGDAKRALAKEGTLDGLAGLWGTFEPAVKSDPSVIKAKDARKADLAKPDPEKPEIDDEIPHMGEA